jgi:hypothetical protein
MSNFKTLVASDETLARWAGTAPESLFVVPGRANLTLLDAADRARREQKPVAVVAADLDQYQWYVRHCGLDQRRMRYIGNPQYLRTMTEPVVIRFGEYWHRSDVYEIDRLLHARQAWVFYDWPKSTTGSVKHESLNTEG